MRPDPARRAWVLGVLNTATQPHTDIKFDGTSVQARRSVGRGNRFVGEHPADTKSAQARVLPVPAWEAPAVFTTSHGEPNHCSTTLSYPSQVVPKI